MYLSHYGVKGMKWGIRRYRNPDGTYTKEGLRRAAEKNLKKANTANLDKWGHDSDHNILYISGYSGSGKSTTALGLAKYGDKVIHLDDYSEPDNMSTHRNKDFDSFLDKQVPNWRRMANAGKKGAMKRNSIEYWETVDSFRDALEKYGKKNFKEKHRVIVEGVQIADDWLTIDKGYYSNKPIVILKTNPVVSMNRAFKRDNKGNLITGLKEVESAKEYVKWYIDTNQRLNDLATVTLANKGKKIADNLLKN